MGFGVVSYNRILKEIKNGKEVLEKLLAVFDCKDSDITRFIKEKSIYHEKKNNMRFHILMDIDTAEVLAIFSLSTQPLILKDSISKTKRKKLSGSDNKNEIQSVMVGVLVKHKNASNKINGNIIFKEVIKQIIKINDIAAIKLMHLECKDIGGITDFYEKNEMTLLSDSNGNPIIRTDMDQVYKTYMISIDSMIDMIKP